MITNFEILTENQHVLISQVILRVGPNGCENQILRHKISNPRISERPIWSIISIEKFIWVLIFLHISHFEQNFSIWTSNFQIFRKNVFCAKSNPKHFRGLLRSWINQDQCEKHKKPSKNELFWPFWTQRLWRAELEATWWRRMLQVMQSRSRASQAWMQWVLIHLIQVKVHICVP